MTNQEIAQEALTRARGNMATSNYLPIFQGFIEKGISQDDIIPRENVLTFHAWKALGRCVKKGEHGVKITTWIPVTKKGVDADTGENTVDTFKRPKGATVFHISQTKEL